MKLIRLMAACLLFALTSSLLFAKPAKEPFGLPTIGTVSTTTDARSNDFRINYLPNILSIKNSNLSSAKNIVINSMVMKSIDPSNIELSVTNDSRMYYVSENAGYKNVIGVNTEGDGILVGNPQVVFGNASTPPLNAGDYVNLGLLSANSNLDFFIISDGYNHNYSVPADLSSVLSTNQSVNLDGMVHARAWAVQGSPYLIFSYEDMYGGGDQDYNDVIFAVDIGDDNVKTIFGAPEPSLACLLMSFGAFLLMRRK